MDTRDMDKLDVLLRTYDGKFSMPEWWRLTERAQAARNKKPLLAQFVKPGDLVFDVGANRGVMTLTFRQLGARVVAVEPLFLAAPELVREFAWRFGEDGEVIPVMQAVSDIVQTVTFSVHKNLPYLSSCGKPWMTESDHARMYNPVACREVRVRTTTLDALITKFGLPRFIKIDVEGYEGVAIRGLSQPVPALSFEFHRGWLHDARQVAQHLRLIGNYEFNYALGFHGKLMLDEWLSNSHLIEHFERTLTEKGKGSWGDAYARLV